jgi:hypothetical protein
MDLSDETVTQANKVILELTNTNSEIEISNKFLSSEIKIGDSYNEILVKELEFYKNKFNELNFNADEHLGMIKNIEE